MEPGLIREAFTKILDFKKPPPNPLVQVLGTGLASYEGDRWAKHRRLINPAFHVEKLKRMMRDVISRTSFGSSYEEGKRMFELQKELADLAIQVVQTLYIPGWR
ncbi:hypothetical protein QQ045_025062 [Rhodiola kirilowii]